MSQAIYRKYRSQTFAELIGHDWVKKVLLSGLKTDKFGHAYLFAGPRGTGKTTIARLIAKSLNCLNLKDGDACGECTVCRAIEKGSFIDLIEIDAASNRGIDEIRLLKEKINFAPAEGKKKIYIIDEVHMLTKEAFNALLKTLEEPPEFVVFVLATTEPHKIPLTILSRLQRFDLKLASREQIIEKISKIAKKENMKLSKEALDRIYELSGGSFRDSESLFGKLVSSDFALDQEITVEEIEECFGLVSQEAVKEFFECLIEGEPSKSISKMEEIIAQGVGVDQLTNQTIEYVRKLIRKVYGEEIDLDLKLLVRILSVFSEAFSKFKDSTISSLPLEIAIYNLSDMNDEKIVPVKQVVRDLSKKAEPVAKDLIDIALVKQKWPEIIEDLKGFNHHLYAFLSSSRIESLGENKLVLKVAYKFHKQKIESLKSKQILEDILDKHLGVRLKVECEVDADLVKNQAEKEEDSSNEALVEEIFEDL